jgi:hypothetical protein
MTLHKPFIGTLKFSYLGSEAEGLWNFTGMSFSTAFDSIMREDEEAYAKAKQSFLWNGLGLIGTTGLMLVSAKMLINAVNEANALSEGPLTGGSDNTIPLLVASGALSIVSGLVSRSNMNAAVRIFNRNHAGRTPPATQEKGLEGLSIPQPEITIRRSASLPLRLGRAGDATRWELRLGLRSRWATR